MNSCNKIGCKVTYRTKKINRKGNKIVTVKYNEGKWNKRGKGKRRKNMLKLRRENNERKNGRKIVVRNRKIWKRR